jgi:hypothetical protein
MQYLLPDGASCGHCAAIVGSGARVPLGHLLPILPPLAAIAYLHTYICTYSQQISEKAFFLPTHARKILPTNMNINNFALCSATAILLYHHVPSVPRTGRAQTPSFSGTAPPPRCPRRSPRVPASRSHPVAQLISCRLPRRRQNHSPCHYRQAPPPVVLRPATSGGP